MQTLFDWADKYRISEQVIPRDPSALLKVTHLDLRKTKLLELPDSFGELVNLQSLNLSKQEPVN